MGRRYRNDKIIVSTPRGQIIQRTYTRGQNKGQVYLRIEWNDSFGPQQTEHFSKAQKFVDSEVLRYCDPLVPMRTGLLKRSGILGTLVGSGEVSYVAPYARRQYYNGRSNGKRGRKWFERMKASHGETIRKGAARIAGGGR